MKTIEIKVFTYDELSKETKEKALDQMREYYYRYNDFIRWAIDDCALLEPIESELTELFGTEYKFPLLKNNRSVFCSLDRNRHIDISEAIEIQNSTQFLKWLGLTETLIDEIDFRIHEDTIEFFSENELSDDQNEKINDAVSKFNNHCQDILNRIESDYEYRFTDAAIIEDIDANGIEFTEDGKIYK